MKDFQALIPGIAVGIGLVIAALIIFLVGAWVGERRIWRHPLVRRAPWGMHRFGRMPHGHGVVGTITAIDGKTLRVADRRDGEKTVLTDGKTQVVKDGKSVGVVDIAVGDPVVVVGEPTLEKRDTVLARIIRVGLPVEPRATDSGMWRGPRL